MQKLLLLVVVLLGTGCVAHVFSPPAKIGGLEGANALKSGETQVGGMFLTQQESFDPSILGGALRARQGLGSGLEIGAEFALGQIDADYEPIDEDLSPLFFTGHVGGKYTILEDYIALRGGVGAGTSDAGQFISPDLGIVLALENPVLVPAINVSGFLSQPVNAQEIDFTPIGEEAGTFRQTPQTSYGVLWSLGLRVPLQVSPGVKIEPWGGFSGTYIKDAERDAHFVGFLSGVDVTF